jgi:N-acetylglutamate synthase-like GNAT family acetyltransferase
MGIDCNLRAARDGDAEAVSQVIVSALRETNAKDYPREVIERLEKNFSPAAVLDLMGKRKVFVATSGPRILGTASLDGKVVQTVFVAPDVQGRGVGRRLMAEVARTASNAGITTLVVQSSVTAAHFYAKLGFKAVRDSYYGEERTVIMECCLTPN